MGLTTNTRATPTTYYEKNSAFEFFYDAWETIKKIAMEIFHFFSNFFKEQETQGRGQTILTPNRQQIFRDVSNSAHGGDIQRSQSAPPFYGAGARSAAAGIPIEVLADYDLVGEDSDLEDEVLLNINIEIIPIFELTNGMNQR